MMNIYTRDGIHILELKGMIHQDETDAMEGLLHDLLDKEVNQIIVDLKDVTNISSSALGVLVALKKSFAGTSGDIKLVFESDQLKDLFGVTMLDRVFETCDTVQEALLNFKK